ncbi:hypothetical protein [Natrinema salaciae]|uniref:Uncharacterized protein n=1 Tax=Natrinema salaciae TaxID=1186196 RepID=A0A1H9LCX0_9EURY|nr:hypothetical protein [Natrinema salaciae]SER09286.1 hypothetical protein SAMN04489841_2928 [Natrinema salaciae]
MSDYETGDAGASALSLKAVDTWIVLGAVIGGVLVNLNALLVPLLTRIGGGVVAGFIAAYAAGRIASGVVHAVIASALVGGIAGTVTASLGTLLGLYNEPPLLVLESVGPISPMLTGLGLPSVVLIVLAFSLLTAVDGLVGGLLGSALRALLPW